MALIRSNMSSGATATVETFTVTGASPSVTLTANHSKIYMCVYSTDNYTLALNGTPITGTGAFQRLASGDNTGCVVKEYDGTFASGDSLTAGGYTAGFPVFLICI